MRESYFNIQKIKYSSIPISGSKTEQLAYTGFILARHTVSR